MQQKIIGADAARACACIAVLLHHWGIAAGAAEWPTAVAAAVTLSDKGKFGVSVFFVLSGFLLGLPFWKSLDARDELPSLRAFVLRRTARLAPATWLNLLVTFAIGWELASPIGYEWPRLLSGFLFVSDWHWITLFPTNLNGPLWSLSYEVSSYAFMALGFVVLHRFSSMSGWKGCAKWAALIPIALVLHALFISLVGLPPVPIGRHLGLFGSARTWFPQYNAFGFFAMFAIGTLTSGLFLLSCRSERDRRVASLALAACFVIAFMISLGLERAGIPKPPFGFPHLPFAIALFLLHASRLPFRQVFENRAVTFVADLSFGIYIWHCLLIDVLQRALPTSLDAHSRFFLICGIDFVGTFTIAYLSYRHFEVPIMQWAKSLERCSIDQTAKQASAEQWEKAGI